MSPVRFHCLLLLLLIARNVAGQTFSPASLPNTRVGANYVQTLTFSPSDPGIVWDFVSGELPPGLSFHTLTGTAAITGQSTQSGAYSFLIGALPPGAPEQLTKVYTIIVAPMAITTSALPGGAVGMPYGISMVLAGGFPGFTWSFDAGTNANGLTMDPVTGFISGTPSAAGSFPINIKVTDSATPANSATRSFTWVVGGAPAINTSSLPAGEVSVPYAQTLSASGGTAPYTWSLATGFTLPPGLLLNAASGLISGTPTVDGAYPVTVQLTDASSTSATRALSITVQPKLAITTMSLPGGAIGTVYSQVLESAGGVAPIVWAITFGVPPPGLNLNSSLGFISGSPTAEGLQTFTVAATDALGATASRQLTLQITTLVITTNSPLPDASQNAAYSSALAATGGTGLSWNVSAGSLPAGLNLDTTSGVIAGTATAVGTSTFIITVTSAAPAAAASRQFSITVTAGPPPPIPSSITLTVPGAPGPAQQPLLNLTLGSSYPLPIDVTVTLAFTADGTSANNPEVRFSDGTRTAFVRLAAGAVTATLSSAIMTGTVAGTITVTARLTDSAGRDVTPSATPVQTIAIGQSVPVITTARVVAVSGGFNFIVTGYSTTKEVSGGTFRFAPAAGTTLTASEFTVPLSSAFAAWYTNPQSFNTGSQFTLTLPFQSPGATLPIASGTAQLTNSRGASALSSPANP